MSTRGQELIDLRSDTVTQPTPAMRRAMADAVVGDDVYGEDPTVRRLEAEVAELLGHEAALFVPSGVMGNQICLRLLVAPGEELLCDADAHVVTYEGGAAARYGGISTRTIVCPRGLLDPVAVVDQLRPAGHTVATRAVAVEQTHNRGGGAIYPLEQLVGLRRATAAHGVALHCDGARIWNAAAATGVELADYGRLFDTLSVCLSKGLGAPIGSLVVTSKERIGVARSIRKSLGGGMRQVGVLAAAGLHALHHHRDRLADDHEHASALAKVLAPYADPAAVQTNIVLIELADAGCAAAQLADRAAAAGVLVSVVSPRRVRLVTHLGVDDAAVDKASAVLTDALAG